jgi:hypothetical protein
VVLHMILVRRWLSGDRRRRRCKGEARGVSRGSLADENRAQGGKIGLRGSGCFLKEAVG